MERKEPEQPGHAGVFHGLEGALDFKCARHEHQHVAFGARGEPFEFLGGSFPDGRILPGTLKVLDVDGMAAALGREHFARGHVTLEHRGFEGGGHDHQQQVGPELLLEFERLGEGDVAVQMPLMELVKHQGLDSIQGGVGEHFPQKDALGHKPDPGFGRGDLVEPDLVTDLAAEPAGTFLGNAAGQHPGGQTARLEHDAFAGSKQSVVEQDLGDLGGFARTGGRLQDEAGIGLQRGNHPVFEFKNGKGTTVQSGAHCSRFRPREQGGVLGCQTSAARTACENETGPRAHWRAGSRNPRGRHAHHRREGLSDIKMRPHGPEDPGQESQNTLMLKA